MIVGNYKGRKVIYEDNMFVILGLGIIFGIEYTPIEYRGTFKDNETSISLEKEITGFFTSDNHFKIACQGKEYFRPKVKINECDTSEYGHQMSAVKEDIVETFIEESKKILDEPKSTIVLKEPEPEPEPYSKKEEPTTVEELANQMAPMISGFVTKINNLQDEIDTLRKNNSLEIEKLTIAFENPIASNILRLSESILETRNSDLIEKQYKDRIVDLKKTYNNTIEELTETSNATIAAKECEINALKEEILSVKKVSADTIREMKTFWDEDVEKITTECHNKIEENKEQTKAEVEKLLKSSADKLKEEVEGLDIKIKAAETKIRRELSAELRDKDLEIRTLNNQCLRDKEEATALMEDKIKEIYERHSDEVNKLNEQIKVLEEKTNRVEMIPNEDYEDRIRKLKDESGLTRINELEKELLSRYDFKSHVDLKTLSNIVDMLQKGNISGAVLVAQSLGESKN